MGAITPELLTSIDVGATYRELRERITNLVGGLDSTAWERIVPHCPEWTVRKTLAHLAGVVDDAINNNLAGVTTPEWTDAQVEKRSGSTGPQIVGEWNTFGPFVDAVATQRGMELSQLLFDAVTHEHDLRHALRVPGARDSSAVAVAVGFVTSRASERSRHGAIQLVIDGVRWGDASAADTPTLAASAFDTIRSFGSRRSRKQVQALQWSVLDDRVLDELPFFGYPPDAISE